MQNRKPIPTGPGWPRPPPFITPPFNNNLYNGPRTPIQWPRSSKNSMPQNHRIQLDDRHYELSMNSFSEIPPPVNCGALIRGGILPTPFDEHSHNFDERTAMSVPGQQKTFGGRVDSSRNVGFGKQINPQRTWHQGNQMCAPTQNKGISHNFIGSDNIGAIKPNSYQEQRNGLMNAIPIPQQFKKDQFRATDQHPIIDFNIGARQSHFSSGLQGHHDWLPMDSGQCFLLKENTGDSPEKNVSGAIKAYEEEIKRLRQHESASLLYYAMSNVENVVESRLGREECKDSSVSEALSLLYEGGVNDQLLKETTRKGHFILSNLQKVPDYELILFHEAIQKLDVSKYVSKFKKLLNLMKMSCGISSNAKSRAMTGIQFKSVESPVANFSELLDSYKKCQERYKQAQLEQNKTVTNVAELFEKYANDLRGVLKGNEASKFKPYQDKVEEIVQACNNEAKVMHQLTEMEVDMSASVICELESRLIHLEEVKSIDFELSQKKPKRNVTSAKVNDTAKTLTKFLANRGSHQWCQETMDKIITGVMEELALYHQSGQVYGHIHPDNILVLPEGTSHLCTLLQVQENKLLGPWNFMAPEWHSFSEGGGQDRASDIYSLGMVIMFLYCRGKVSRSNLKYRHEEITKKNIMLKSMLDVHPWNRPQLRNVQNKKWFKTKDLMKKKELQEVPVAETMPEEEVQVVMAFSVQSDDCDLSDGGVIDDADDEGSQSGAVSRNDAIYSIEEMRAVEEASSQSGAVSRNDAIYSIEEMRAAEEASSQSGAVSRNDAIYSIEEMRAAEEASSQSGAVNRNDAIHSIEEMRAAEEAILRELEDSDCESPRLLNESENEQAEDERDEFLLVLTA